MPRNLNPGSLTVGHGKAAPDEIVQRPAITGAGLAGPGPNIGGISAPTTVQGSQSGAGLLAHVNDLKAAHQASAIELDGHPDVLISTNVDGALDELIGAVAERPPFLGQWAHHTAFSGITDWGFLKLRDQSLEHFSLLANKPAGTNASIIFPYYFDAPGPPQDTEFTQIGGDPRPDHLWNDGMEGAGEPGMGVGRTHMGAFTRDGDAGPAPLDVFRVTRLYPRPTGNDAETGRPARVPVTVSGTIFPADRGVLALFHFPPSAGGDMATEFLAQPLISDHTAPLSAQGRVVAALLLGNGVLGSKTNPGACDDPNECDGEPGSIFALGSTGGHYNPFAFPGRAAGQYDLAEIHAGVDKFAEALNPPFDDFDGDTNPGAARTPTATVPAPGQVRLGTDPDAGVAVVSNGIPVLGATAAMYTVAPVAQNGSLAEPIHGDALVRASNFFRYRLPVLKDYSPETGLKWTPRGEDPLATKETFRFFDTATPNSGTYPDGSALGASLRSAGFFESSFTEDYWVWQVARYRQTFLMPSIEVDGNREEVGTYWLVHFKTEADFERFARDGTFPWDVADGYEVYGASLVDTSHVEADGNVANEWLAATPPAAPDGPAPLYGFAANAYHQLRSTVFLDPAGSALPAVAAEQWDWSTQAAPATAAVMWVSGVAYFTPRVITTGASSFALTQIQVQLAAGFWTSYRTDDDDLSGAGNTAPAVIASMNPMFVNNAPFGYGAHPGGAASSLDLTTGGAGAAHVPDATYQRNHRFELPFTFLGSNASGVFTNANGPLDADTLDYDTTVGGDITLQGDNLLPSFTRDAAVRVYFRRPIAHVAENTAVLPFAANDGHGQRLTPVQVGTVLYHSTRFDEINLDGAYGNFLVGAVGAPPNTTFTQLFLADKDDGETFLDEVYRIRPAFTASLVGHGPYTQAALDSLVGPGMQGWVGGPIEVPVRIALGTSPWDEASFLLMEDHLVDLSGTTDLQVAGLPDRNPPLSAGVEVPFPSSGILMFPKTNFSAGHFPQGGGVHVTAAQPNYSGIAGLRDYVRCLDTAHSRQASPVDMAGQSEVTLRLDGITLEDIAYSPPGPGGIPATRPAVLIKVPGLTTWMDIGRVDGSGPSKQDPNLDGAGCQIVGALTYTFTDPVTGYKGCYVRVHVGPVASFFINPADFSGYTAGSPADEAPILVKVQMDDRASPYDLATEYLGGGVFGFPNPGHDPRDVRGIIGISIVHPDETLLVAD